MNVHVDPAPTAALRFLDASLFFHGIVEPEPDHTLSLPSYIVRREAPKGRPR